MERLLGQEIKLQLIPILIHALMPRPSEVPLELVLHADLIFVGLVAADLTVGVDSCYHRDLPKVLLFDEVRLSAEACVNDKGDYCQ